jgi:hypothetical protein
MARKAKKTSKIENDAKFETRDRQVVDLDVNMFVLKQNAFLILPETPNIYLSPDKAKKLIADLSKAVKSSRDGVIVRFKGSINPRQDEMGSDGSMFLTRELSVGEIEKS